MKILIVVLCIVLPHLARADEPIEVTWGEKDGYEVKDWKTFEFQNNYCEAKLKQCPGGDLGESEYESTARQCQTRCSHDTACVSVYYNSDKMCQKKTVRCTPEQLVEAVGTQFYRLAKGETCDPSRPQYFATQKMFSRLFCLRKGKRCLKDLDVRVGTLYRKPQAIRPWIICLQKCAKIKTCSTVDFRNNKCDPMELDCDVSQIVEDPDSDNYVRLEAGVKTCPGGAEPITAPRC